MAAVQYDRLVAYLIGKADPALAGLDEVGRYVRLLKLRRRRDLLRSWRRVGRTALWSAATTSCRGAAAIAATLAAPAASASAHVRSQTLCLFS